MEGGQDLQPTPPPFPLNTSINGFTVPLPFTLFIYAYGRIRNPQQTYVKGAVHKAHFKMNRAFKVIQGHPYWCQQESITVCCRNVQLIPTLLLKPTKIWQREKANSSISTTPLKFEDVPARNAFAYLQMIYIARN